MAGEQTEDSRMVAVEIDRDLLVDERGKPTELFWSIWRSNPNTQTSLRRARLSPNFRDGEIFCE